MKLLHTGFLYVNSDFSTHHAQTTLEHHRPSHVGVCLCKPNTQRSILFVNGFGPKEKDKKK